MQLFLTMDKDVHVKGQASRNSNSLEILAIEHSAGNISQSCKIGQVW